MPGLICGCSVGLSGSASTPKTDDDEIDPLLDVSLPEEQEVPALTVGTTSVVPVGEGHIDTETDMGADGGGKVKVALVSMDSKVHASYLETMLAVGVDGCAQVREVLEGVIKGTQRG